jgi:hypothetical protein
MIPLAVPKTLTTDKANHEKHSVRIAIDPAYAEKRLRRIAGRQRRREALA